jgi:hypothetical protein
MVPNKILVEFDYECNFLHYEGNIKFKSGVSEFQSQKLLLNDSLASKDKISFQVRERLFFFYILI